MLIPNGTKYVYPHPLYLSPLLYNGVQRGISVEYLQSGGDHVFADVTQCISGVRPMKACYPILGNLYPSTDTLFPNDIGMGTIWGPLEGRLIPIPYYWGISVLSYTHVYTVQLRASYYAC